MKSHYKYGIKKEKQIARQLRRKGYKVTLSKSSRGPSDIKAQKGSKKWVIQVKASRKKVNGNRISSDELRRLKIQARKARATPVLAQVTRGAVQYCSARINRKLKP